MIRDILMAAAGAAGGVPTSLLRGVSSNINTGAAWTMHVDETNAQPGDLAIVCVSLSGGGALVCDTPGWTDHGASNLQGRFFSKVVASYGESVTFSGSSTDRCTFVMAAVKPEVNLVLGTLSTGTSPATQTPASISLPSGGGVAPFASMVWANCVGNVDITGSPEYARAIIARNSNYPTVAMFFRDQPANGTTLPCTLTFTGTAQQTTSRQVASAS